MFKCLKQSLDIDIAYSVNSFLYALSKLPGFKNIISSDVYTDKTLKKIVGFLGMLFSLGRAIALKFLYFFIIFYSTYKLFPKTMVKSYFHIYFFFTLIGLFINNKLLNTNKKKYFSIILFNMDSTKYFRACLFWNQITSLILNTLVTLFFGGLILSPIRYSIMLIVFTFFIRLIGEALNIMFYKRYKYIWYSNNKLYFSIVLSLFACAFLPYLGLYVNFTILDITTIITIFLGILSLIYLLKIKDYKLMYKKLSLVVNVMDHKNEKDYLKQAMVELKDKDKKIDNKKLEGKKGYDLFNTIFFERHKEILLRSARKYSVILIGIYIILGYLVLTKNGYYTKVNNFYIKNIGWFGLIMFIVNRGAIITQAMFFNCDHAMLRYNFFREPNSILDLFKKRLIIVSKVNLLPAFVIGVGNIVLLILTNNTSPVTLISNFLFIVSLSIFFSVHYLVIYYLFQPFNKEMEVKKMSYSIMTLITYMITYSLTRISIDSVTLSIFGVIFTIIYVIVSLKLVYKYAPETFKLN